MDKHNSPPLPSHNIQRGRMQVLVVVLCWCLFSQRGKKVWLMLYYGAEQRESDSLTPSDSSFTLLFQTGHQWDHCRAGRGVIISSIVLSALNYHSHPARSHRTSQPCFPPPPPPSWARPWLWRWQQWSGNCRWTGRIARSQEWCLEDKRINHYKLVSVQINTNHLQSKQHRQQEAGSAKC